MLNNFFNPNNMLQMFQFNIFLLVNGFKSYSMLVLSMRQISVHWTGCHGILCWYGCQKVSSQDTFHSNPSFSFFFFWFFLGSGHIPILNRNQFRMNVYIIRCLPKLTKQIWIKSKVNWYLSHFTNFLECRSHVTESLLSTQARTHIDTQKAFSIFPFAFARFSRWSMKCGSAEIFWRLHVIDWFRVLVV